MSSARSDPAPWGPRHGRPGPDARRATPRTRARTEGRSRRPTLRPGPRPRTGGVARGATGPAWWRRGGVGRGRVSIRSSAGSPSSTITSHSSSQRPSTSPRRTPTTTKGRLPGLSSGISPGGGIPTSRGTITAPLRSGLMSLRSSASSESALRSSRIARRYPADSGRPPGGALGRERRHGADRASRPTAGAT